MLNGNTRQSRGKRPRAFWHPRPLSLLHRSKPYLLSSENQPVDPRPSSRPLLSESRYPKSKWSTRENPWAKIAWFKSRSLLLLQKIRKTKPISKCWSKWTKTLWITTKSDFSRCDRPNSKQASRTRFSMSSKSKYGGKNSWSVKRKPSLFSSLRRNQPQGNSKWGRRASCRPVARMTASRTRARSSWPRTCRRRWKRLITSIPTVCTCQVRNLYKTNSTWGLKSLQDARSLGLRSKKEAAWSYSMQTSPRTLKRSILTAFLSLPADNIKVKLQKQTGDA